MTSDSLGNVYAAGYDFGVEWSASEAELLAPEAVVLPEGWALAGNAFAAYGERLRDIALVITKRSRGRVPSPGSLSHA